ncbi:MAG: glycosyltransferase family 2 protein [Armatimonadota bacterium]|jgi:glycosyltransferase involved in cell wall biosynthesis
MFASVLVSTYNSPEWLEKALWGYSSQTYADFEVVIADDGSTDETRELVERMRGETELAIRHVWHEDQGYRRQTILNRALEAAEGSYVICTDGDCIPRRDFVQAHCERARRGCFLSGGYCKLPMDLSRAIGKDDILSGRCFDPAWLARRGLQGRSELRKLRAGGIRAWLLNALTTTQATWNNCNSSGWMADLVAVNGFDERMQYGGADRELGERLVRHGIRPMHIRYDAIVVHLDHARGYADPESREKNRAIRRENAEEGVTVTEYGIVKGPRSAEG